MSNHLNTILSFLSESFENGRAYSTIINGYRSMFSSTLDKVAGKSKDEDLSLAPLSRKLANLLALATLLRVSELVSIDMRTIRITPQ
ncbi:hypothetical protein OUZ56_032062 [Daphnia magna]|uniref:Tyr recombinase domain-containing protein n=1 Tax=Daphnia magna TaxID=35525 RepID=A0ABQ9ZWE5_9CRUS|nr:hypothetical protein OUZ56_032062 [Daphnia magna]